MGSHATDVVVEFSNKRLNNGSLSQIVYMNEAACTSRTTPPVICGIWLWQTFYPFYTERSTAPVICGPIAPISLLLQSMKYTLIIPIWKSIIINRTWTTLHVFIFSANKCYRLWCGRYWNNCGFLFYNLFLFDFYCHLHSNLEFFSENITCRLRFLFYNYLKKKIYMPRVSNCLY